MKKGRLFIVLLLSFLLLSSRVSAKTISKICRYTTNNNYSVIYSRVYDNGSADAYVKIYTESSGTIRTYDGIGKSTSIKNWSSVKGNYTDDCAPMMMILADSQASQDSNYNVYLGSSTSDFDSVKSKKDYNYVLNNDDTYENVWSTCDYHINLKDSSDYIIFRMEIGDFVYNNAYYIKSGESDYTSIDMISGSYGNLENTAVYENNSPVDLGATVTAAAEFKSWDIYNAYKKNGNTCPPVSLGGTTTYEPLLYLDSTYSDVIQTYQAVSSENNSNPSGGGEESNPKTNTCSQDFTQKDIKDLNGNSVGDLVFDFNTYQDGTREFCARLKSDTNAHNCIKFKDTAMDTDPETGNDNNTGGYVTFTISGTSIGFTILEKNIDEFFTDKCIDNFYVAGGNSTAFNALYVLTTNYADAQSISSKFGSKTTSKKLSNVQITSLCGENSKNCNISLASFCTESNVARTFKFVGLLLTIVKILVPTIIIVMGFVNLFQIITSGNEENAKKYVKNVIIRILIGVGVFLLPSIVLFIFNIASNIISNQSIEDSGGQYNCLRCVLEPSNCQGIVATDTTSSSNDD